MPIAQLCGIGGFPLGTCTEASYHELLPSTGKTWQIDIDTTAGKVLWWNPNDAWNKARQYIVPDFSDMYHLVMVFGGGTFELNVDNSFLKTRYDPARVSFPTSRYQLPEILE